MGESVPCSSILSIGSREREEVQKPCPIGAGLDRELQQECHIWVEKGSVRSHAPGRRAKGEDGNFFFRGLFSNAKEFHKFR